MFLVDQHDLLLSLVIAALSSIYSRHEQLFLKGDLWRSLLIALTDQQDLASLAKRKSNIFPTLCQLWEYLTSFLPPTSAPFCIYHSRGLLYRFLKLFLYFAPSFPGVRSVSSSHLCFSNLQSP